MKTNFKKIMNLFLAFLMVLTVFVPLKSFAEEDSNGKTTLHFTKFELKNFDGQQESAKGQDPRVQISGDVQDEIAKRWNLQKDDVKFLQGIKFSAFKIIGIDDTKFKTISTSVAGGTALNDAIKAVSGASLSPVITTSEATNSNGITSLALDNPKSGKTYYVITEDSSGTDKHVSGMKGIPTFVSLPQSGLSSDKNPATDLYFYPKNTVDNTSITKSKTVGNKYVNTYTSDNSIITWYLHLKIPKAQLKDLNGLRFEDKIANMPADVKFVDESPVVTYGTNDTPISVTKDTDYTLGTDSRSAVITLGSSKLTELKKLDADVDVYVALKVKVPQNKINTSLVNMINDTTNGFKAYFTKGKNEMPKPDQPVTPVTPGQPGTPGQPPVFPINPPSGKDTEEFNPKVQLGGIKVTKMDEAQKPLNGAKFYLYRAHKTDYVGSYNKESKELKDVVSDNSDKQYYASNSSGDYIWIDAKDVNDAKEKLKSHDGYNLYSIDSDQNGILTVKGLEPSSTNLMIVGSDGTIKKVATITNTYKLQEYQAPNGYNLADDTVVNVVADKDNGTENQTITDTKPFMPLTGGRGKVAFIGAGIVFLALAGYVYRKRRNEA